VSPLFRKTSKNRVSNDIIVFLIFFIGYRGKGKVVPVLLNEYHAMKAYRESGGIAPYIIDLGTRWR
jgi:hypothetical protein